jgi:hypothetical protein
MTRKRFPAYGFIGCLLILLAETPIVLNWLTGSRFPRLTTWTTPLSWWGYILLVDALIFRLKGNSLIRSRFREFLFQIPISVVLWLLFEAYNLHLKNWTYIGLPQNAAIAWTGRIISFGTILPAILETTELLQTLGAFSRMKIPPMRIRPWIIYPSIFIGLALSIIPLLLEEQKALYLFAFVWMGFVFLLDPIVYSSGGESLLGDLEKGNLDRILSLAAAGYVCGFLWEFWNYWAAAKWMYTIPFTPNAHIFEMPMAGFLGFGPFAWEFFCMYQFVRLLGKPTRA